MSSRSYALLMASLLFLTACGPSPSESTFWDDLLGSEDRPSATPSVSASRAPDDSAALSPVPAGLTRVGDQSGEEDSIQDMRVVSANYRLSLPTDGSDSLVEVPVNPDFFPDKVHQASFQPEYRDASGNWIPDGKYVSYDAQSRRVRFLTGIPRRAPFQVAQEVQTERIYRIRVYFFSNQLTVQREGSAFRIHYYPSKLANRSRVRSDSEWNSSSGLAVDPAVPDFIEDLDHALNTAYERLLQLQHSAGTVFRPLSLPQDVYVEDIGGDAGDSQLGGPLRISNTRITNLEDLRLTAAHELVHVFQGQYYTMSGLFSGRQNRWFIEAVANYYSAQIFQLTPAQKHAYYGDFYADYLSVALNSTGDNHIYASAHLLDWLSETYHPTLVGDALRLSSGNDIIGLSNALKAVGQSGGISGGFEEYAKYLISHPDGYDGFNREIKAALRNYAIGYQRIDGSMFNNQRTLITLKTSQPLLSLAYLNLSAGNTPAGLLVMDSSESSAALMKSWTYDFSHDHDAGYTNKTPIDSYNQLPSKSPLTIKNFGKGAAVTEFEQMLANTSPASVANLNQFYYLLLPPKITHLGNGSLRWTTAELGNIPKDWVTYEVYYGRTRVAQNIKAPTTGNELEVRQYKEGMDPALAQTGYWVEVPLEAGEPLTVVVRDRRGHSWPELKSAVRVSIDPYNPTVAPNQSIVLTATVSGDENQKVKWEAKSLLSYGIEKELPTGTLTPISDNQVRYTAPADEYMIFGYNVKVTATSEADPTQSASIEINVDDPETWCVLPGSLVTRADGTRQAIESLKKGDQIQAWEEGRPVTAQVEQVLIHRDRPYPIRYLRTDSGDELQITANHPVLAKGKGWTAVEKLKPGDVIYTYDRGSRSFRETTVVVLIEERSQAGVVYNLKTSRGNYIANDLLIHNKCLMQGSLIETAEGLRPVESLQIGDKVWADHAGKRVLTPVTHLYRKATVLPQIPGKRLNADLSVTVNHLVWSGTHYLPAGQTPYADTPIPGTVYDLQTAAGNYYGAGGILMRSGN